MLKFLDENGLKIVKQYLDENKQDTLVSGDNIKTLNSESLLGSGNINIETEAMTPEEVELILTVDPILANNSWATIRTVCEAGKAAEVGWQVGDTKTDVGMDGTTRTFRICDMQGLYGKHVVFEQVELESTYYKWASSNLNNYSLSDMRTTHLPAILAKYSSELQSSITNTTYKVATTGNDKTLLELTDKLFLPAERELYETHEFSWQEEWDELIRFQYYVTHNTNANHIKYRPGSGYAVVWWQRSPFSGNTTAGCNIAMNGKQGITTVSDGGGVAPFFSF